jgi:hypothetical protein
MAPEYDIEALAETDARSGRAAHRGRDELVAAFEKEGASGTVSIDGKSSISPI